MSNQFPQPPHTKPRRPHLWRLTYNGQLIIGGCAYPACVAKRNELMLTGNYTNAHFKITPHL